MPAYSVDCKTPAEKPLRGYFMRHKSGEAGFSWKRDDPMFGPDWERIPAIAEPAPLPPVQGGSIEDAEGFHDLVVDIIDAHEVYAHGGGEDRFYARKQKLIAYIDAWAARRAAVPDGYAVVPIKPTLSMIEAYGHNPADFFANQALEKRWKAMIAAAPSNNQKEE
jgi:hypothetical protein